MPSQQTCAPSVATFPARLDGAAAEQAAGQITAAFTPGVRIVIADLTATARCDRSAIRNLLKAHRKAAARDWHVRFAIRPGGPLHQLTGFAGSHPLLAVYPTLQHALTGESPLPAGNRTASRRPRSTRRNAACDRHTRSAARELPRATGRTPGNMTASARKPICGCWQSGAARVSSPARGAAPSSRDPDRPGCGRRSGDRRPPRPGPPSRLRR